MKKEILKYAVIAIAAAVVLTLALAGAHRAQKPEKEKKPRPNIVNGTGSLKEKAKSTEGGQFLGYATPGKDVRFRSIAEVAESSSVVITGTPQSNRCRLSEDETSITINYQVNVQEVIKGDLQPGSTVTVKLPGGKVTFPDGTSAEVRAPWFKWMQNRHTYVLFLNVDADGTAYVTTGGPQGVFEIPAGNEASVKSNSGINQDPMWKYHDMKLEQFMDEVRKGLGKEKKAKA
jgi:hypothetical protein